ncbi:MULTISPECIES: hypothetical protein [unclassified Streptomyces]|nr:hypothetical protein [Streptomyces sp. TSRI0281]
MPGARSGCDGSLRCCTSYLALPVDDPVDDPLPPANCRLLPPAAEYC